MSSPSLIKEKVVHTEQISRPRGGGTSWWGGGSKPSKRARSSRSRGETKKGQFRGRRAIDVLAFQLLNPMFLLRRKKKPHQVCLSLAQILEENPVVRSGKIGNEHIELKVRKFVQEIYDFLAHAHGGDPEIELVLGCLAEHKVLNQLVSLMQEFEFEGRKEIVDLYAACVEKHTPEFVTYMKGNIELLRHLPNGYAWPDIALNLGLIFRQLLKFEPVAETILRERLYVPLIQHVRNSSYDLASDAWLSLKECILNHKRIAAAHIDEHFEFFFHLYNDLLCPTGSSSSVAAASSSVSTTTTTTTTGGGPNSGAGGGGVTGGVGTTSATVIPPAKAGGPSLLCPSPPPSGGTPETYTRSLSGNVSVPGQDTGGHYVTLRHALKLLSDMLLDRTFVRTMLKYVAKDEYLKLHMNLLKNSSKAVQFEVFHIFKIFVANPNKPTRIQHILYQNKDRLLRFFDTFLDDQRRDDEQFQQDRSIIVEKMRLLEPPPPTTTSATGAHGKDGTGATTSATNSREGSKEKPGLGTGVET